MNTHRWMSASLLMGSIVLQATVCNAEPRIGTTASARPNADAVSGENIRALSAGSEIYANQTVRTGNRGKADLVFIDSTNLGVGPSSEVRLDRFTYDPRGSSGSVVMNASRGAFRFVTGTQDHKAYQVNTPHGSLGVNGTTVEVTVNPNPRCTPRAGVRLPAECENECVTKVRLVEGEATYDVAKTGKKAHLTQPNQVACIIAEWKHHVLGKFSINPELFGGRCIAAGAVCHPRDRWGNQSDHSTSGRERNHAALRIGGVSWTPIGVRLYPSRRS